MFEVLGQRSCLLVTVVVCVLLLYILLALSRYLALSCALSSTDFGSPSRAYEYKLS